MSDTLHMPIDRLPDEDLVDIFLNGSCAAFAVAAARALTAAGRPAGITVLFNDDGEPNTQDDRCAIHAYASCDVSDVDARGVREPSDMADEYGLHSWSIDGPFCEDEFRRFFCEGEEDLDLDEHWIGVAADLLERRPDLLTPKIEEH